MYGLRLFLNCVFIAQAALDELNRSKSSKLETIDALIESITSCSDETNARIAKLQLPEETAGALIKLAEDMSQQFAAAEDSVGKASVAFEARADVQAERIAAVEAQFAVRHSLFPPRLPPYLHHS